MKRAATSIGWLNDNPHSNEALAPEQVAQAAREEQEPAKCDQIPVDDPGKTRLRKAEVSLNRGESDVHDRHIDDDQQESGAEDHQREPARVLHARLDDDPGKTHRSDPSISR
jgi:hypothetical protein